MRRDLQNSINQYKAKFFGRKDGRGSFTLEDYYQIKEIGYNEGNTLPNYIDNALMAGFMIGYRYGKKEAQERKKK